MHTNSSVMPSDEEILFTSLAKIQKNLFTYPPEGRLMLTRDRRLIFVTRDGLLYDWPLTHIANVRSPWYQVGQGFRCEVNGVKYWIYFNNLSSTVRSGILMRAGGLAGAAAGVADALPLAQVTAGITEIAGARGLCSAWKDVIAAARLVPSPPVLRALPRVTVWTSVLSQHLRRVRQ